MPRRKKVITEQYEVEEPAGPAASDEPRQDFDPEAEEVNSFLSRLAIQEGRAAVYRMGKSGAREWCLNAGLADVNEEWIFDNCGPGKYLIRVMDARGRYIQSITLMIAERKEEKSAAAPVNAVADMQVALLRDQLNRQQEILLKMLERSSQPPQPPPQQSIGELVAALKGIWDMTPKAADPTHGISTIINSLTKGIELAQAASSGDDKMSWIRIIEHVADKFPGLTQAVVGAAGGVNDGAPSTAQSGDTSAPHPGNGNGDPVKLFLRQSIGYLKKKALMRQDPEMWVEWISNNLDEEHWLRLAQLLQQPFERIAEVDPEISSEPLRSWFMQLFNGLRDALSGRGPGGGEGGDGADAPADAGPGH
jgi:hypothetical protein